MICTSTGAASQSCMSRMCWRRKAATSGLAVYEGNLYRHCSHSKHLPNNELEHLSHIVYCEVPLIFEKATFYHSQIPTYIQGNHCTNMSGRAAAGNRPGARFAQFKLVLLGKLSLGVQYL